MTSQRLAALLVRAGRCFIADATQLVGRLPLDLGAAGVDAVSISGHKICGPTGVGALIVSRESAGQLRPVLHCGGHERGLRSGSLNVAGIVGLGAASVLAVQEQTEEARSEWLGSEPVGGEEIFEDVMPLSTEARADVSAMVELQIMDPVTADHFDPRGAVTREDMALFLARILEIAEIKPVSLELELSSDSLMVGGAATATVRALKPDGKPIPGPSDRLVRRPRVAPRNRLQPRHRRPLERRRRRYVPELPDRHW